MNAGERIAGVIILMVVVGCAGLCGLGQRAAGRKPAYGPKREAYLHNKMEGGKTRAAPVAETQEALQQYEKIFRTGDSVGVSLEVISGRIELFNEQAPVFVIEDGFPYTSFRDPRRIANLYWVRSEYVHPTGK
jgi:hypothetical protein